MDTSTLAANTGASKQAAATPQFSSPALLFTSCTIFCSLVALESLAMVARSSRNQPLVRPPPPKRDATLLRYRTTSTLGRHPISLLFYSTVRASFVPPPSPQFDQLTNQCASHTAAHAGLRENGFLHCAMTHSQCAEAKTLGQRTTPHTQCTPLKSLARGSTALPPSHSISPLPLADC